MSDIDVSFQLLTPTGWIELEDPENGYELERGSFATRSVSHRSNIVNSEWVAGSYASRSVRDNITEDVSFYVGGATTFECRTRMQAVLEGFEALTYQAIMRIEDYQETWTCIPADYTLESDQPLIAATLVLVRAKIPRHPAALVEQWVAP